MNILVTGANGFVGKTLCSKLVAKEYSISGAVMTTAFKTDLPPGVNGITVGDIGSETDWKEALDEIDTVVHLAARVHIMNDNVNNPLVEFRKVNTAGTLNLAKQAAAAGVKRFVFISSIKVNGEQTDKTKDGIPDFFSEHDVPDPQDPYAVSKWEAEEGLKVIAKETGLELIVIRPPLVYGIGVKANLQSLIKLVCSNIPLPLGLVHNKRSFIALDNLVSFIIHCLDHPRAANETFLISDDDDVSTTELLRNIAQAYGKRLFLLPVPVGLLSFFTKLLGKQALADRLFGSLQIDSSKAKDLLGWKPVVSMVQGLNSKTKQ
jgi:nucleoside-diphosphate-sugar epimerase